MTPVAWMTQLGVVMGAEIHAGYTEPVVGTTPSGGDEIAGMPVVVAVVLAAGYAIAVALTLRPVLNRRRGRHRA